MKIYLVSYVFVLYLSAISGQYYQQNGDSRDSYGSNSLGSNDQSSRSSSGSLVIPIGFTKYHPIEYIDYKPEESDGREPQIIQVEGGNTPLNIIFNPRLSHLSVADKDDQNFRDLSDQRYTFSEEEPIITYHEMNTPVFEDMIDTYHYGGQQDEQQNYHKQTFNNINYDQNNWQITEQQQQSQSQY